MPTFSYLHALIYSFFSKDFYRDVAKQWKGLGFFYLFLMVLACCAALSVATINAASKIQISQFSSIADIDDERYNVDTPYAISVWMYELLLQSPPMWVENGELKTSVEQPYIITKDDSLRITIDLTAPKVSVDNFIEPYTNEIRLFKDSIVVRKHDGRVEVHDLSEILNESEGVSINGDYLISLFDEIIDQYSTKIILFTFLILSIFLYIFAIICALIYGAIGTLFNLFFKANLQYTDIVRLAVLSGTPTAILFIIITIVTSNISLFPTGLAFFIDAIYLAFALYSNKSST